MTNNYATIIGNILQLFGAAYIVYQSYQTTKNLKKYKGPVTYDSLSPSIETLANELSGQFNQQLIGFILLFLGSALQLYAAI